MLSRSRVGLAAVVLAAGLIAGCGEKQDGPAVTPTKGRVVLKGKGEPLPELYDYNVEIQSTADPKVRAVGRIDQDGTFTLGCLINDKPQPGVPPGDYKARIAPPLDDFHSKEDLVGKMIHPRFGHFDKSGLTVAVGPKPQPITLEVERRGR